MSDDAIEAALRALRHRDRTARELDRRLEERGFSDSERAGALDALSRTRLVDDARFAAGRARVLATRGAGDAYIRHELEAAGVDEDVVADTITALEPEVDRASRLVERRGASTRTARYLRAKGFADDVVARVVARGGPGALG